MLVNDNVIIIVDVIIIIHIIIIINVVIINDVIIIIHIIIIIHVIFSIYIVDIQWLFVLSFVCCCQRLNEGLEQYLIQIYHANIC